MSITLNIEEPLSIHKIIYKYLQKIYRFLNFRKFFFNTSKSSKKTYNDNELYEVSEYDFLKNRQYTCRQQIIQLNQSLCEQQLEYNKIIYLLEDTFGESVERKSQDKGIMTDNIERNLLELYCKPCLQFINNAKNL